MNNNLNRDSIHPLRGLIQQRFNRDKMRIVAYAE